MTDPVFQTMMEEEYLRWDGPKNAKWEFIDGFVYPQAGASRPHGLIAANLLRAMLNTTLLAGYVIPSDMKVRVSRDGCSRYYLPDIVMSCDSHMIGDAETTPCLLVEILSAQTRTIDTTFKASDYRSLKSLQGYLLVDSEQPSISPPNGARLAT